MKTIQLKTYGMGRYGDVSPFPMGDLELEIFGIPDISAQFRFLAKCNGAICAESTVSAARNRVTIPREKLSAGRFSCEVRQYDKGTETKIFKVEDLLITDISGDLSADPEIAHLRREIEELRAETAGLGKLAKEEKSAREKAESELKELLAYAHETALGLLKFAFEDYRENVYLGGGTFEEFLTAYGLSLKEFCAEEIKKIKGDKDND